MPDTSTPKPPLNAPSPPQRPSGPRRAPVWIGAAILVILVGWTLRVTAVVAVPIVFAFFIAVVLAPLDRVVSQNLPRPLAWLGRIATMLVLLVALAGFFAGLVFSARQVIDEVPNIVENLEQYMPASMPAMREVEDVMGEDGEAATAPAEPEPEAENGAESASEEAAGGYLTEEAQAVRDVVNQVGSTAGTWLVEGATGLARRVLGAVGTFVAATIIVVFMVLLALGEAPMWQRKLDTLWPRSSDRWEGAFATISRKLRTFLIVRAAMGALTGALYVGWLLLFDIGLLPVWFVMTFLLGFIPNLGSIISGILPTLYVLITKDLQSALLVGAGLFAIEQTIGNFVDPRMQGRQISISPLVVIVSILVWGWLWGAAGALLAVPIMVGLMVGFAQVPALQPLALLMSNKTDHDDLKEALAT